MGENEVLGAGTEGAQQFVPVGPMRLSRCAVKANGTGKKPGWWNELARSGRQPLEVGEKVNGKAS